MNVLLIDNLDSFSYLIKDYLDQCGANTQVVRSDSDLLKVKYQSFDAIVVGPGPGTPDKTGNLMGFIELAVQHKPVLGICLGHQAIGLHFGADLHKAIRPMHGKVEKINHTKDVLFDGLDDNFEATRYHSLIVDNIPESIDITAYSKEGEVMGIHHKRLPVWGIQFHPESCKTIHGIKIIENFLCLAGNKY